LITISFIIPTSGTVLGNRAKEFKIIKNKENYNQFYSLIDIQQHVTSELSKNKSFTYIIFSAGLIANSYFVKIPRLLTQRGIIIAAQIRYKLPPAFTIVFEKSNDTGIKLATIERGNHRVILFGIGHSSFTRPHLLSFGRIVAISRIKPIVF
jgi:hypothetical protein